MEILGIDIGGSGIKGAIVDTDKGDFITERLRIATPQPSTPAAVAKVVAQISSHFDWRAPIGCTFPAVVKRGVTLSAANVDKGWIGKDAAALLGAETGNPVLVLNDADAAGIAEMRFGAGRGRGGLVVILTLGTGYRQLALYGRHARAQYGNGASHHSRQRRRDARLRTRARNQRL